VTQHRVDFNGDYLVRPLEQRFGERTPAGSDFDDQRGSLAACSLSDSVERRCTG
jgi:hypothetical protein